AKPFKKGVLGAMVVPSFHEPGLRYRVGFDNLPLWRSNRRQAYARGFNSRLVSDSPREFWEKIKIDRSQGKNVLDDNSTKESGFMEQRWDHHAVFAYFRVAQKAEQQGDHLMMPFRRPDARTLRMYWKMIHHVLRREQDNNGKWHLEPLRGGDVELLLWKYVARRRESARMQTPSFPS
ncbi:hypothetical protein KY329_00650, partial [Candidatus Woesearchaeota archaeon]|nr:hypothetical protein [Candidatus Woesearchaeota archaeon]